MSVRLNHYQQPVGDALDNWTARPWPERVTLSGQFCRLEPLNAARHADALWVAHQEAEDDRHWTYLPVGPFHDREAFHHYLVEAENKSDPIHFAVISLTTGEAVGTLALMRIDPANGVIEVGHVSFSPALKRTPVATDAHFLLMNYVFSDLGYRRYEWKCDSLNGPSRRAAERLGFSFEGIFRQAIVYKGRTRDTAWFSVIDGEWPSRRNAFSRWLAASNFDANGQQIASLASFRTPE